MDIYNPNLIEKKWQDFWDKKTTDRKSVGRERV